MKHRKLLTFLFCLIIMSCQRESKIDPIIAGLIFKAETSFKSGFYNAALAFADSALKIDSTFADGYFMRGRVFTKLSRLNESNKAYRKVLSINSHYKGAWFNLGTNSLREDNAKNAIVFYNKENENHPSAQSMIQIGRAYERIGKIDSAVFAYNSAIKIDNENASAHMRLSHIHKDNGDISKAIAFSLKGTAIEPNNLDYKYFMGSLFLSNGDLDQSISYLQDVVNKRPWHYWSHHSLGQALYRIGNTTDGERYMDLAKEMQKEIESIDYWNNLANMNPDQTLLWINLGDAYRKMSRFDEAKNAFQVALSLDPKNVAIQNNLANLYLLSGDTLQAVIRYEAILASDPTLADIWINLGVVYINSGRKEEARKAWAKGLEQDPDNITLKQYINSVK
tara:strand:- start:202 stop:1383 length:1182 start_codon:yes stop_codon:yes gene_type:complete